MAPINCPWAFDSNDCELDPGLKEAHRVALQELKDGKEKHEKPILLRNLLTHDQIDEILREASKEEVWPRGVLKSKHKPKGQSHRDVVLAVPPCRRHRLSESIMEPSEEALSEALTQVPHHLAWSPQHVALYMHSNDHWFVRTLPALWSLIRGAMESRPWMNGAIPMLEEGCEPSMEHLRTIELHHYAAGGGLLDPGHRDCGSDLTISVLLSDPADVKGGDFVTYDPKGVPIAHKMKRGDAILFESEKLHNIGTVTSGVRQSLVVELWPSKRY